MPKINAAECQTLEFKREWTDRALEDLAAFANTEGGTLLLGVRKDGEIVGVRVHDQELQRIANLIASNLGITPSIRVREMEEPSLEGLQRKEIWEYPLEALREAVINALIHRDYTAYGDIQIRITEGRLQIWNPGGLPEGIRIDQLREPEHPSIPRNPLLSRALYYAGLIEHWGTGTTRILELCKAQGLPEPEFLEQSGSFKVVFLKDPYTPERLRKLGLNERQIKAVLYVKEWGSIGNKEYQELTGVKERTATLELGDLVKKGILIRIGTTGRGTRYAARKAQKPQ